MYSTHYRARRPNTTEVNTYYTTQWPKAQFIRSPPFVDVSPGASPSSGVTPRSQPTGEAYFHCQSKRGSQQYSSRGISLHFAMEITK
uniref:Uncharacterized protein n=1 Tax=Oryza punctata TaxID=4537 RepID=A0A0E0L1Y0_ORYPU